MVNTPKLRIRLFVLAFIVAIAVLNELNRNAKAEDISFTLFAIRYKNETLIETNPNLEVFFTTGIGFKF